MVRYRPVVINFNNIALSIIFSSSNKMSMSTHKYGKICMCFAYCSALHASVSNHSVIFTCVHINIAFMFSILEQSWFGQSSLVSLQN